MRIAVDLSYIYSLETGGKTLVPLFLLKGFLKEDTKNEYTIICNNVLVDQINRDFPRFETVAIPNYHKFRSNKAIQLPLSIIYKNFAVPYLIKKQKPHVVFFPHECVCLFNLYKNSKTIMHPHDIQPISNPKRWPFIFRVYNRMYYTQDFRYMDKIIAISDSDKGEMDTFFPQHTAKFRKIYNPIDTDVYERSTSRHTKENTIVAVNYFDKHKNAITLLKAFHSLYQSIDHNLILIGTPNRTITKYIQTQGLEDRVIVTGYIDDDTKNEYLANCSLYVNPTLFEGFGMTAVEALMLGAPCLLSDIPVNREVTMGLADYYAPPEDAIVLAEKILESLAKTHTDQELTMRAGSMIERYNYTRVAKEYIMLFEECYRELENMSGS